MFRSRRRRPVVDSVLRRAYRPIVEQLETRVLLAVNWGGPTWDVEGPSPITKATNVILPNGPTTGAVNVIVPHPGTGSVVYVGTTNGGVWRSDNARASVPSWTPLTDYESSLSIMSLAISPFRTSAGNVIASNFNRSIAAAPSIATAENQVTGAMAPAAGRAGYVVTDFELPADGQTHLALIE